jgi:hypothetical protein
MRRRGSPRTVAEAVELIVGPELPIAIETYDGGRIGPTNAVATLVVRSSDAFLRSGPGPFPRQSRTLHAPTLAH